MLHAIWYTLYDLKKREKHPWRCVTFSKVAGCSKVKVATLLSNTPPLVFSMFFVSCTNGTK